MSKSFYIAIFSEIEILPILLQTITGAALLRGEDHLFLPGCECDHLLPIVKKVCELHNGEVSAESKNGKTTFTVTLPRKPYPMGRS